MSTQVKAAKVKTAWYCGECGHRQAKWSGQCPQCREWNTMHEEAEAPPTRYAHEPAPAKPMRLSEITVGHDRRHTTCLTEFDRLVGGGLTHGSLTLIAGDPGIGKSTLLLQVSQALAESGLKVLYVCGEESVEQTYGRAHRLGITSDNLFFLSETLLSHITHQVEAIAPDITIVDSIQIVYKGELSSAPGSVSQVRETAAELMHLSKRRGMTTLLVGHVTKSGEIAGPRVLEHLVDTVLYFEGSRQCNTRMIRVVKNRFGPTDEIGVFRMSADGLHEITNPSEIFLEERTHAGGSTVNPVIEGSRPILVEVQALVTKTVFPNPSRRCAGLDSNRLALLLAVLEKRLQYRLYGCDVFVSLVGGLKITEPSLDLGIALAVASSFCNRALPDRTAVIGEVGLAGEVRSVTRIDTRIKEASRLGFDRCIVPKRNLESLPKELTEGIQLIGVQQVEEAIHALLPE